MGRLFARQASNPTAVAPRACLPAASDTKGDMSTETSAPRLRPHFTLEPGRWMKAFGAHPCLSVEVVVQHTRVDSTQSAPALMTTIVFPLR